MPPIESVTGPLARIRGEEWLQFASNDYLGLATHPDVTEAAARAARDHGVGAGAARLLAGNSLLHRELEERLAAFRGEEDAILFSSGYLANLGLLQALSGPGAGIASDAMNHASLIDACRLSRAEVRVYDHLDAEAAGEALASLPAENRWIATDGLFSMDGDVAPLRHLMSAAERHGASILVDDAHGTGVLGATGRGITEASGVRDARILVMGTLSKALGALGGFLAGPKELVSFLRNRCRTFVYSTAPPIPVAAAATKALDLLEREPARVARLHDRARRLRTTLAGLGLPVPESAIPIVPVILETEERALAAARALAAERIFAPAIRPPTVPAGTARLRLSVTSEHADEHIDRLAAALRRAL